jgi:hypothetical protein
VAGAQWNLLPVGTKYSTAADNGIHLLLTVRRVIVLRPFRTRGQLKLIDPKTCDPELIGQRTNDSMRRLHIAGVNDLVRTHHFSSLFEALERRL